MYKIDNRVYIIFIIFFISLSVNSYATDYTVSSPLELYNVRDDLAGSYTQTANINLIGTDPTKVPVWSNTENYLVDDYVKNVAYTYTYICLQANTGMALTNSYYWQQLWATWETTSEGWDPIGNWDESGDEETEFTGTYDGGGFTISNLTINTPTLNMVGLFGCMIGTSKTNIAQLKNIKLIDVTIKGRSGVGSLLGKIDDNQYVVIDRLLSSRWQR